MRKAIPVTYLENSLFRTWNIVNSLVLFKVNWEEKKKDDTTPAHMCPDEDTLLGSNKEVTPGTPFPLV